MALDVIVGLGLCALETILLLLHDSSSRWPRVAGIRPSRRAARPKSSLLARKDAILAR
jgi:hypothetical protein